MTRLASLAVLALLGAGCVSSQEARNGAIRFLNAVPDGPRMSLSVDDVVKFSGNDFGGGTPFLALSAGTYTVKIDELLPAEADPDTKNVIELPTDLGVNDELNLIVVGEEGAGTVEVLQIPDTTVAVATGRTRLGFVHAAVGEPAFDLYVIAPDAVIAASTPLQSNLAYKQVIPALELSSGNVKVVLTAVGDPNTVLFESGTLFLSSQRSFLIAIIPNVGVDADTRPFLLAFWAGSGSTTVADKNSEAAFRLVNASPGAYDIDVFVNDPAVVDTERQTCDPLTVEEDTLLELCAVPFTSVGPFNAIDPGTYDLKIQKTGDAAVAAETLLTAFAGGIASTAVVTGLLPDTATTTALGVKTLFGGRRVATAAQLRVVDLSLAADIALGEDPTTDRLELYIKPAGTPLDDETADYVNFRFGADTGYIQQLAGSYDVTLVQADTATPDVAPVELLSRVVALADGGIYTLLIIDSIPAALPVEYLSIDDDPGPP